MTMTLCFHSTGTRLKQQVTSPKTLTLTCPRCTSPSRPSPSWRSVCRCSCRCTTSKSAELGWIWCSSRMLWYILSRYGIIMAILYNAHTRHITALKVTSPQAYQEPMNTWVESGKCRLMCSSRMLHVWYILSRYDIMMTIYITPIPPIPATQSN